MALTRIKSSNITDNTVVDVDIADDAVTNAKIADDAVTNAKIADDVVTNAKIADDAVTNAKIADGAITNDNLASTLDLSGKIVTLPSGSVTTHVTSYDDNKLVNDISTLALRQSSNENKAAYNTNSMYVDVFQDSTGITNLTNTTRDSNEFISTYQPGDSSVKFLITGDGSGQTITDATGNHSITVNGNTTWSTTDKKFGTSSIYFDGNGDYLQMADSNDWYSGQSGNGWTFETWYKSTTTTAGMIYQQGRESGNGNPRHMIRKASNNTELSFYDYPDLYFNESSLPDFSSAFRHIALVFDDASNEIQFAIDGVWQGSAQSYVPTNNTYPLKIGYGKESNTSAAYLTGYLDGVRISNKNQYTLGTDFTPPAAKFIGPAGAVVATGSFESNVITAPLSTSSMGAIITYQDQAGTNTLNTDIVLQLSADGGTNYATATLTAMPDFSSGIKMAKVNDLSVTAGTSLKYKLSFANQASGTKEARIRGVALQY